MPDLVYFLWSRFVCAALVVIAVLAVFDVLVSAGVLG